MIGSLTAIRLSASSSLTKLRAAWPKVVAAFESPWVAYPLILILQLKVIWGLWALRDVTTGDTTSYFIKAWSWYQSGGMDIAWSPLYTSFYGCFLFINSDPVWATFAHRVTIIMTTTFLVLAVLRQLLPASIAWVCTAWWAVLPIVFNTLYEVHLFAAIPVLTAWLLMLTATGPWRRAAALAIFAGSAVLVRNELSVPTAILGAVLAVYEFIRLRRGEGTRFVGTLLAYAIAMSVVVGLCGAAYKQSYVKYPMLTPYMKEKHTLNMAQVYAFGYQQRHPEWTSSPWIECHPLMEETFGNPSPTLREMIAANPKAVFEHFMWNTSLTPNGFQLLLFHRAAGSINPDYDPSMLSKMNKRSGAVLTVALLSLWAVAAVILWRGRREWWQSWFSSRALGWAAMFAVVAVIPLVICTQRPRPSYLFAFAAVVIAITGMCLHITTTRWRLAEHLRTIAPLLMVGFVLFVPRHFVQSQHTNRWVANSVERLLPYREAISNPGTVLLVQDRVNVGFYIHPASTRMERKAIHVFGEMIATAKPGESFAGMMERNEVDYAYIEEQALAWLKTKQCDDAEGFMDGRGAPGWELLAAGNVPGDRWRIYHRVK
ncbi:MAG: hypothetical protein K8U57_04960 [Planctomycetes bacterium]|nr:hypothetical protein [Planctomycetota bacterium]